METVTITQITPPELEKLIENSIKKFLNTQQSKHTSETDRWFDLAELCIYHPDRPQKPTVYGWVNAKSIPVHKSGKKLRFLKSEIDTWLKQGRKKTLAETESDISKETDAHLLTLLKKKGGKSHE